MKELNICSLDDIRTVHVFLILQVYIGKQTAGRAIFITTAGFLVNCKPHSHKCIKLLSNRQEAE